MYESELQKMRRDILRAISASSRQMLDDKVKNHGQIAISYGKHVKVIDAEMALNSKVKNILGK